MIFTATLSKILAESLLICSKGTDGEERYHDAGVHVKQWCLPITFTATTIYSMQSAEIIERERKLDAWISQSNWKKIVGFCTTQGESAKTIIESWSSQKFDSQIHKIEEAYFAQTPDASLYGTLGSLITPLVLGSLIHFSWIPVVIKTCNNSTGLCTSYATPDWLMAAWPITAAIAGYCYKKQYDDYLCHKQCALNLIKHYRVSNQETR